MNSTREHRGAEQRDDVELHGDAVALVPEPVHFAHHALLLGHGTSGVRTETKLGSSPA